MTYLDGSQRRHRLPTGYNVVYGADGMAGWSRAATNHADAGYTLHNARNHLSCVFGVQAVNSAGASGWTNSAAVPAVASPPASP